MKIIEKLKDIWEDIVFYVYDKPKWIYKDIRHWVRTCARFKTHWQFSNFAVFHCYPWDYYYFLEIQYKWIKKSNKYFNTYQYCSDERKNEINRYQRICLGLLEIMLDKRKYYEYDTKNHKTILYIPINLKNKHRFPYVGMDPKTGKNVYNCTQMYDRSPDEYYKYKAKYLYYKILREYSESWWD